MKRLLIIPLAFTFSACETTDSEGNVTRFDAKGATEVINAGLNTWQQYDRQSRIIGYAPDGTPIYRQ